ncbi:hypothetical protein HDK64DRAFT_5297 [Phyllosticta capitalensis]
MGARERKTFGVGSFPLFPVFLLPLLQEIVLTNGMERWKNTTGQIACFMCVFSVCLARLYWIAKALLLCFVHLEKRLRYCLPGGVLLLEWSKSGVGELTDLRFDFAERLAIRFSGCNLY